MSRPRFQFAGGWPGVEWPPVVNGRCTVHDEPVGPVTRICFSCHREQLEAAGTVLPTVEPLPIAEPEEPVELEWNPAVRAWVRVET